MTLRIGALEIGPGHPCRFIAGEWCQEWPLGRTPQGYGQGWRDGAKFFAHRVVAEQFYGPLPPGAVVCHHCDNPSCVNPKHLYVGTAKTNQQDALRRGRQAHARKTHCPRGHPYDDKNTKHAKQRTGRMRQCRACARERMRDYNAKNRDRINARQRAYNARKRAEQCSP